MKSITVYSFIMYIYYVLCQISLCTRMRGCNINLYFIDKTNLMRELGFTAYTSIYYIITPAEVSTYNKYPVRSEAHEYYGGDHTIDTHAYLHPNRIFSWY